MVILFLSPGSYTLLQPHARPRRSQCTPHSRAGVHFSSIIMHGAIADLKAKRSVLHRTAAAWACNGEQRRQELYLSLAQGLRTGGAEGAMISMRDCCLKIHCAVTKVSPISPSVHHIVCKRGLESKPQAVCLSGGGCGAPFGGRGPVQC